MQVYFGAMNDTLHLKQVGRCVGLSIFLKLAEQVATICVDRAIFNLTVIWCSRSLEETSRAANIGA